MAPVRLLILLLCLAHPAAAQDIIADLSQSRVSITASFSGSSILVFGAIRPAHGAPPPGSEAAEPLDVIVTVSGPLQPAMVRKKERVAGIWVNTQALQITAAPAFYKVATTRPLPQVLSATEDLRHHVSIPRAIRAVGGAAEVDDTRAFAEALIRIRTNQGLYGVDEGAVSLAEQTLFRTNVELPANLVEGDYQTRIFLTRDRAVVAEFERTLNVRKVGLERWIYTLAQEQALLYGLLSLTIAIAAGWSASALFRYVRGT